MSINIGYVYSEFVNKHCHPTDENHLEGPLRIQHCKEYLSRNGWLDKCIEVDELSDEETLDCIRYLYLEEYLNVLESCEDDYNPFLKDWGNETSSLPYVCKYTKSAAIKSVACLLGLLKEVFSKKIDHGIAIIRPPGHHSELNKATGFCFLNNVAIGCEYALRNGYKKILILDWDVHFGNGLSKIFYHRNDVLYISFHRYDNGKYYPFLQSGNVDSIGLNVGKHYNINIAWNDDKMEDGDYKLAFDEIVLPILKEYQPNLVMIACGFDAMKNDPLGCYNLTPYIYEYMTANIVRMNSKVNVVLVLEGGYDKDNIAKGFEACLRGLLLKSGGGGGGDGEEYYSNLPCKLSGLISRGIVNDLKNVHGSFWNFD